MAGCPVRSPSSDGSREDIDTSRRRRRCSRHSDRRLSRRIARWVCIVARSPLADSAIARVRRPSVSASATNWASCDSRMRTTTGASRSCHRELLASARAVLTASLSRSRAERSALLASFCAFTSVRMSVLAASLCPVNAGTLGAGSPGHIATTSENASASARSSSRRSMASCLAFSAASRRSRNSTLRVHLRCLETGLERDGIDFCWGLVGLVVCVTRHVGGELGELVEPELDHVGLITVPVCPAPEIAADPAYTVGFSSK